MQKKNITKIFYLFLFSHLIIWTLVPSILNLNLPLDTIEALAWGSNLDWGFNKHPPFSAFVINIFYTIFGSSDWSYYFLSQICVLISFIFIWQLSKDFFSNKIKIKGGQDKMARRLEVGKWRSRFHQSSIF